MPSPIAHSLAAYLWYRVFRRRLLPAASGWAFALLFLVALVLSMLPDTDSVVGILAGDLAAYHNKWTHSLLFGLAVGLAVGLLARALGQRMGGWFLFALICCETHTVMDFFTVGRGVMAFWPLTSERFGSPVRVFYGVRWSEGLMTSHHFLTAASELLLGVVVLLVVVRQNKKSEKGTPP